MASSDILDRDALSSLVLASRDPGPRETLALPQAQAVIQTASSLIHVILSEESCHEDTIETLTQAIRVLRNSCAAGPVAGEQLLALGLIHVVASTLDAIAAGLAGLNWTLPGVTAQLLANAAASCAPCASALWATVFPDRLLILSHVDTPQTQEATALSLLTMCKSVDRGVKDLVGLQGGPILAAMLHAANRQRQAHTIEGNESLSLLITFLCFEEDVLEDVFAGLSAIANEKIASSPATVTILARSLTAAHAYLLQELMSEAHCVPPLQRRSTSQRSSILDSTCQKSMSFLIRLLCVLTSKQEQPLSAVQQQVLHNALHVLRDLCGRDDEGSALLRKEYSKASTPVESLLNAGLVPVLLSFLKALGPITNPRRDAAQTPMADLAPKLSEAASKCTSQQPYDGYRSDILSGE